MPILTGEFQIDPTRYLDASITSEYDVANEYSIQYPEDSENTYLEVGQNETLIHHVVFRTSRYATLEDKLANLTLEVSPKGTVVTGSNGQQMSLAYDQINIPMANEAWEEIEMIGHSEVLHHGSGTTTSYFAAPRVIVKDPFEGHYFDNLVKPKMDDLIDRIRLKIDVKIVGLENRWNGTNGFITFYEGNYNYINNSRYSSNNANTYGIDAVLLNNYYESSSFFASPITQSSSSSFLNNLNFIGSINIHSGQLNSDVVLKYDVRNFVKQDIEDIVEWSESALDNIKNGNVSYEQTWSNNYVNNYFASTFEAYNDLVTSSIYNGNASTFDYGQSQNNSIYFTTYGSLYNTPPWPFIASNIRLYYNTRNVDHNSSALSTYGSNVSKVIND